MEITKEYISLNEYSSLNELRYMNVYNKVKKSKVEKIIINKQVHIYKIVDLDKLFKKQ